MASSDLPKSWTELTKIMFICGKRITLKKFISQILFTEKKSERFSWFLMPKSDFESTNFANYEEVVHNFGRSDDEMMLWKNASIYADVVWCPTSSKNLGR